MFDKGFLRKKDIWLPKEYMDNFNPYDVWQTRCFFFTFNLHKIANRFKRKAPELVEKIMDFILEKQAKEDGEEYTDFEKAIELMDYEVNGEKLFKSSREYLIPKWLTLHNWISKAFQQLSLNSQPSMDLVVAPVPVKIEKVWDRKSKTEQKIREAIKNLRKKKIKITYTNIMKETGIRSRATISRNGHLLK